MAYGGLFILLGVAVTAVVALGFVTYEVINARRQFHRYERTYQAPPLRPLPPARRPSAQLTRRRRRSPPSNNGAIPPRENIVALRVIPPRENIVTLRLISNSTGGADAPNGSLSRRNSSNSLSINQRSVSNNDNLDSDRSENAAASPPCVGRPGSVISNANNDDFSSFNERPTSASSVISNSSSFSECCDLQTESFSPNSDSRSNNAEMIVDNLVSDLVSSVTSSGSSSIEIISLSDIESFSSLDSSWSRPESH